MELDGSASVLFSGGEGNQSQIDAGVEAYRGEAERIATERVAAASLEMPDVPDPNIWADSARRVLEAGGMVVRVTRELKGPAQMPSVWGIMQRIKQQDEQRAQTERP